MTVTLTSLGGEGLGYRLFCFDLLTWDFTYSLKWHTTVQLRGADFSCAVSSFVISFFFFCY